VSGDAVSRGRCLTVWLVVTGAAGSLTAWLLPHLAAGVARPPGSSDVEAWLVLACEAAAVLAAGWLWLIATLVATSVVRGRVRPATPRSPVRRLVLAACGVGIAGGLAGPAYAGPPPSPLDGLPLPDRPTGQVVVHVADPVRPDRTAAPPRTDGPHTVRVVRGDSLWALAADELPAGAADAAVDARWRAIHAANRGVIGDDPDLILPGQRLRLPPIPPTAT